MRPAAMISSSIRSQALSDKKCRSRRTTSENNLHELRMGTSENDDNRLRSSRHVRRNSERARPAGRITRCWGVSGDVSISGCIQRLTFYLNSRRLSFNFRVAFDHKTVRPTLHKRALCKQFALWIKAWVETGIFAMDTDSSILQDRITIEIQASRRLRPCSPRYTYRQPGPRAFDHDEFSLPHSRSR